jgi:two-component system cell cycle sensor histidine kinase/response regulator CckA
MEKSLRVLVVEDSVDDAQLLLREIERGGYAVEHQRVESAAEMGRLLKEFTWDIVISDYSMPKFNAIQALEVLKASGLDLPFIIVSGTIGEDVAVSAMRGGAHDYLLKGKLKKLIPVIQRELRDASEREGRRRADAAFRQSEARNRDLVENARDIIYEHDLDGNYTSSNKAGEQITGYSREETLKLNIAQTVAPEYLEKAREMLQRKIAGESVTAYEVEVIAKDGSRVAVEVNTRLVFQNGIPVGVQGIARDVTERKKLEEQLRQAQKLEAVGQLAGGIAHDFNNLLTVIIGFGDLALARIGEEDPLRKHLLEIKKAGDRATALTRQLLAFSRKQVLQPRIIDLTETLANIDKMLQRLIGEDIQLVTILDPSLGKVMADPGQIEQVIMNLAVNARDAMPKGGNLTIETKNVFLDEAYSRQHVSIKPGPFVMLAVSDTGHGMDSATQAHIFEPFFTTKEHGKGTGLGLSMVYGIVKQSGGNIWVYSEPAHGTTFKIYLPLIRGEGEGLREEAVTAKPQQVSETVLLVEDEDAVRMLLLDILQAEGYKVLPASSGYEALEWATKHNGRIDLLLTDVVMPGMSGSELVDRLADMLRDVKVLYMSGYTDDAIIHHGVLNPGVAFLQKPFTPLSVARKVRDVLNQ